MFFYFFSAIGFFIIEKIRGKIIKTFLYKSTKMITWKNPEANKVLDYLIDWVLL